MPVGADKPGSDRRPQTQAAGVGEPSAEPSPATDQRDALNRGLPPSIEVMPGCHASALIRHDYSAC